MRRISEMSHEEIVAYNLRDGGNEFTVFEDTQFARVERARSYIRHLLHQIEGPATIWELGCSAGDISGPFAKQHNVVGVDVTPGAALAAAQRYPEMTVLLSEVTKLRPAECDILVLCEFLEHIVDPIQLVQDWMPTARFSLIGHPLNDPGGAEPGHIWSYTIDDYRRWFEIGGHREVETQVFTSPFPEMVMGIGARE